MGIAVRRAPRWATVVVLAAVLLDLSACGDGEAARQSRIDNPARPDSVNADVGPLRLLAVRIETPEDAVHVTGGDVGLFLTVANGADQADTLSAVSAVDARQVAFRDGAGAATSDISVRIPARGVASLQYPGGPHLELVGLRRDIVGGHFMPVTFRFADAGVTTVNVFVQGFGQPTVAPAPSNS